MFFAYSLISPPFFFLFWGFSRLSLTYVGGFRLLDVVLGSWSVEVKVFINVMNENRFLSWLLNRFDVLRDCEFWRFLVGVAVKIESMGFWVGWSVKPHRFWNLNLGLTINKNSSAEVN